MSKINIFLVDDNALYLMNMELSFGSKPYYNISRFATGELCIENLSSKPDIIILDYYLNSVVPDAINGLETLVRIRQVNPLVPVIILTGEEDPEIKANCLKHKATEYIIKSDISFARLREIITRIFLDKSAQEDLITHLHNAILHDNH